ncbi:LysR substrate-binding domain-containing protein, partial [Streptomyces sp. NPDC051636]|uniref:LysR substrate-binding domain-containing protein n=1 Tax=Streptomyces sp. NPDC051636 TaxID=3365663 RepID=UPI00378B6D36
MAEQLITDGGALRLTYDQVDSHRRPDLLRSGALAFGVLRPPVDTAGLLLRTLTDEPLGIVLRPDHALARHPELTWDQLTGQRLLWFPARRAPGYAAAVLDRLREHGWTPKGQDREVKRCCGWSGGLTWERSPARTVSVEVTVR